MNNLVDKDPPDAGSARSLWLIGGGQRNNA